MKTIICPVCKKENHKNSYVKFYRDENDSYWLVIQCSYCGTLFPQAKQFYLNQLSVYEDDYDFDIFDYIDSHSALNCDTVLTTDLFCLSVEFENDLYDTIKDLLNSFIQFISKNQTGSERSLLP